MSSSNGQNHKKRGPKPFYKDAKTLQTKIDEYFLWIEGEKDLKTPLNEDGTTNWIREPEPKKIGALCYYLGFESRSTFYEMEKREELAYTIKRARFRIEIHYEGLIQRAMNPAGPIFALKNLGWSDANQSTIHIHIPQKMFNLEHPHGLEIDENSDDEKEKD